MKLIIIRHGDPDYEHDSLTEKGWREAELLSYRTQKMGIDEIWCSPLGRAQDTAKATLEKLKMKAITADWLQEFAGRTTDPETGAEVLPWDFLPRVFTRFDAAFDYSRWLSTSLFDTPSVKREYQKVCEGLDSVLAKHGYIRDGKLYRTEKGNTDTVAFFCHYGVESFMLSHLLHCTPMTFLQHFVALPTSATVLSTEEREKGLAIFRCSTFGDTSHLYAADEPPSFAARFCETYENFDQRH